jgi:hypothetical protein
MRERLYVEQVVALLKQAEAGAGSAESLLSRLCGFSACHIRLRALVTMQLFNIKSRRV